jgi:hypothetical protein
VISALCGKAPRCGHEHLRRRSDVKRSGGQPALWVMRTLAATIADAVESRPCPTMTTPPPSQPFFLIVADYDRGFFTVEGPMTDDRPWNDLARHVRDHRQFHVVCGPTGPDRDELAAEFRKTNKLAGAPPGSVMRPRQ